MDLKTLNKIEKIILIILIPISIFKLNISIILLALTELGIMIYRNKLEEKIEEENNNWKEIYQSLGEVEYIMDKIESWDKDEKNSVKRSE